MIFRTPFGWAWAPWVQKERSSSSTQVLDEADSSNALLCCFHVLWVDEALDSTVFAGSFPQCQTCC